MKRGFTALEMMVVIAVIAILSGILTPLVIGELAKAKINACQAEMENLRQAITSYAQDFGFRPQNPGHPTQSEIDRGSFPRSAAAHGDYNSILSDDLITETDPVNLWNSVTLEGWRGPYIDPGAMITVDADGDSIPETDYQFKIDPWNRYFIYGNIILQGKRTVVLLSGGPDKILNTSDDLQLAIYYGDPL